MKYGVDILDLWRGRLSLRRIHSLLGQWTTTDYMLANVADMLNIANWQRGSDPQKPTPAPDPIPRPGDEKLKAASAERILSKVAKFREKKLRLPVDDTPREEPA